MKKVVFVAILVTMNIITSAYASKARVPERLIDALIQQESNGDDHAIGDKHLKEKAYGCLQIRKPCLDDVNKRYGTSYQPQDMLGNRSLSVWVCTKYLEMYTSSKILGRQPTEEDLARVWNGGPTGWKKSSTNGYWVNVQRKLARR